MSANAQNRTRGGRGREQRRMKECGRAERGKQVRGVYTEDEREVEDGAEERWDETRV